MNQSTAVTISWILAAVLILAVAAALYAAYYAVHQRSRAETAEQALRGQEDELEQFTTSTMPYVADAVRRSEVTVEIPVAGGQTRLGQLLHALGERYIGDLRMMQAETRDRARREADYEAQQAAARAEAKARTDTENAAREATSAAVRAFGTSVVSLGADVSQVVSTALREHRGDDVYETLTRIDHSVQQMIRQAQSYVIVCGGLPGRRWPQQALTDVVGGAVGRVRDFTRVRPHQLDRVVISRAVEPLVHTLATLLDNALRYSPPTSFVDVTFQEGHHGVTVIVDDAGVRMNAEQMEEARQVLAGERVVDIHQLGPAPRVGFPGIAALARRYGFTVYIDGPNTYGGMRAMVYVPEALLAPRESSTPEVEASTPPMISAAPEPATSPSARHGFDRETADSGQAPVRMTGGAHTVTTEGLRTGGTDDIRATASGPRPLTTSGAHAAATDDQFVTANEAEDESESISTVHEITPGGLPRRRRRTVSVSTLSRGPDTDTELPRPDIAAAWQSGTQSGRTSATHENTEGMTS
ncbi:ATP-binding protein [Nocardia wallacei]|uniref:ATP-binding protein n=1 Tax=Nocardia wallacei TaxID=480035 RepID=UPI00245836D0|nr:sensor histidine kinase [Nocardia wallacei]